MFRATLLLAEARRTCLPGSYTVVQHLQTPGLPVQVGDQRLSTRSLIHATNPSLTNSERLFHNERRHGDKSFRQQPSRSFTQCATR